MPSPKPATENVPAAQTEKVESVGKIEIPEKSETEKEIYLGKAPSLEPVPVADSSLDSAVAPFVVVPHELQVETDRFIVTLSN